MAEIVPIKGHRAYIRHTKLSAAQALANVKAMKPREVLIIAIDGDGDLIVHGSPPDPGNAMWLMARATKKLTNPGE